MSAASVTKSMRVNPFNRRRHRTFSLTETARMFDRHFDKYFCKNRPWMRRDGCDPVFSRPDKIQARTPREVALAYLGYAVPERGLLKRMAAAAGLPYARVASAISYERLLRRKAQHS